MPQTAVVFRELLFFLILCFQFFLYSSKKYFVGTLSLLLLLLINLVLIQKVDTLAFLGFKSLIPLFLLFVVPRDGAYQTRINWNKFSKLLLCINLLFQLTHLFFGQGYYARILMGLNSRNPGLFLYPAASSFFTLILFLIYLKTNGKKDKFWPILFWLSIILCASLTGMAGMAFIYLTKIIKLTRSSLKYIVLLFFMLLGGLLFLHSARSSMNGPAYLLETSSGRFKILTDAVSNISIGPEKFGQYTNAAVKNNEGTIPDSFYTSYLGNLGVFWSLCLAVFFGFSLWRNYKMNQALDIIFLFLLAGVSINVTETGISIFLMIYLRYCQLNKSTGAASDTLVQ